MVKAASEGLGLSAMAQDFGDEIGPWLYVDATAAMGVAQRVGLGKLRHLETQTLWLQQAVKQKRVGLAKVLGTINPADLMTKFTDAATIARLLQIMSLEVREGRAEIAPDVEKEDSGDDRIIAAVSEYIVSGDSSICGEARDEESPGGTPLRHSTAIEADSASSSVMTTTTTALTTTQSLSTPLSTISLQSKRTLRSKSSVIKGVRESCECCKVLSNAGCADFQGHEHDDGCANAELGARPTPRANEFTVEQDGKASEDAPDIYRSPPRSLRGGDSERHRSVGRCVCIPSYRSGISGLVQVYSPVGLPPSRLKPW